MKRIITIYGNNAVGKTTVIATIYDCLLKKGATEKVKKKVLFNGLDFQGVLTYKGKDVAFMSMGDYVKHVNDAIRKFKTSDILITAYNTRHKTLSFEWLKYAEEIRVVNKTAPTDDDRKRVENDVLTLI